MSPSQSPTAAAPQSPGRRPLQVRPAPLHMAHEVRGRPLYLVEPDAPVLVCVRCSQHGVRPRCVGVADALERGLQLGAAKVTVPVGVELLRGFGVLRGRLGGRGGAQARAVFALGTSFQRGPWLAGMAAAGSCGARRRSAIQASQGPTAQAMMPVMMIAAPPSRTSDRAHLERDQQVVPLSKVLVPQRHRQELVVVQEAVAVQVLSRPARVQSRPVSGPGLGLWALGFVQLWVQHALVLTLDPVWVWVCCHGDVRILQDTRSTPRPATPGIEGGTGQRTVIKGPHRRLHQLLQLGQRHAAAPGLDCLGEFRGFGRLTGGIGPVFGG